MRTILRFLAVVVALVAFAGLLGATVEPLKLADDDNASDDDDGPSFYARANPAPPLPSSAIQIQLVLLKSRRG